MDLNVGVLTRDCGGGAPAFIERLKRDATLDFSASDYDGVAGVGTLAFIERMVGRTIVQPVMRQLLGDSPPGLRSVRQRG